MIIKNYSQDSLHKYEKEKDFLIKILIASYLILFIIVATLVDENILPGTILIVILFFYLLGYQYGRTVSKIELITQARDYEAKLHKANNEIL